jgi:nucleotide-binding universal stress UspA family protein
LYSRAWASNADAAASSATNVHHGNVVAAAICRHADATAADAAAICRAAPGSPFGERAVNSQVLP